MIQQRLLSEENRKFTLEGEENGEILGFLRFTESSGF
jgi:hypothetical protein